MNAASAPETPILPAHIEDTVRAIAELHQQHYRDASAVQRAVERLTAQVGRPEFVGLVTLFIGLWVGANTLLPLLAHLGPFDPAPFSWLQGVVGTSALYVTLIILTTQRSENRLAEHRAQLTLELAILGEQKSAKTIALLEEMRRDNPLLRDRVDDEADAMAEPADPQSVLDAIRETHDEMRADDALAAENGSAAGSA